LALDLLRDTVCAGDRFLLCSDGLTRTIPESEIEAWMDNRDIGAAVEARVETEAADSSDDGCRMTIGTRHHIGYFLAPMPVAPAIAMTEDERKRLRKVLETHHDRRLAAPLRRRLD
jgi:hypothetical protein